MLILSLPAVYSLELTSACNNGCPGCFTPFAETRRRKPLPASAWEGLLNQVGPEAARIRLTGGEPTLHPEFERIFQAACAFDAQVTVFTNARWPNPPALLGRLCQETRLAGLLVSLHGARAETHESFTRARGSFNQTMENTQRALDLGITVAFSTVITRQNQAELEEIAAIAGRLGAAYVAFNRDLGPRGAADGLSRRQILGIVRRIEALARQGSRVTYGACIPQCLRTSGSDGCMAGITQVAIDPWGNVRPCIYAQAAAGNVFTTPLAEIWHGPAMQAWRADEPAGCGECAAYPVCHGGCRAARERYASADPLEGPPRRRYTVQRTIRPLPEAGRASHALRIRKEAFGYSLIGKGQVWPVLPQALEVISACDGQSTIAELRALYAPSQLQLLEELWNAGLIDILV